MRRGGVAAWVTGIVLILSGCGTSAAPAPVENPTGSAGAPTGSASASTPPAGPGPSVLDGDWVLWVTAQSSCPDLDGRRLHVANELASIALGIVGWRDPVTLTGPATADGSAASMHLSRTKPTADDLELNGAIKASGDTISGKGRAGGVHPGGQNGYSCTFTFTLERLGAGLGDACTTPAVQAAVLDAKGMAPVRIEPDSVICAEGWATARVDPAHAGQELAVALESERGRWVRHTMSEACNWKHPETGKRPLPIALASSVCGG